MDMQIEFIRRLPSPQELMAEFPSDDKVRQIKKERDEAIKNIIIGKDDRFLLVIGPCSADNEKAVLDYIHRLVPVQEKVKDKIFIIPRVYTSKPRTIGIGYKGMLHQPDPEGKENLLDGIIAVRNMNTRIIKETGFTCAEEILYPEMYRYVSDLMSYAAVGARSVEDQLHRMIASGVGIPVGMKNPTSGDIPVMLNSIEAAQHSQEFLFRGWEVRPKATLWLMPFCAASSINSATASLTTITKTFSVSSMHTTNGILSIRLSSSIRTMPTRAKNISNKSALPKTLCKAAA